MQILILTGSESTSITLTWVLSLLLNHPCVLKAARRARLAPIVKETLRLYPPGPVTGRLREAMEDCNVDGYYVPKGTHPHVWSNPSEFKPERFMTTHANVDVRGQNFEYIPFSSDRRSCPGLTFGMQVVHSALARLLQVFDIMTVGGAEVDMREGSGLDLPKVDPLNVILKPRLPKELY
ncbi:hypothetical protein ACB092_12G211000 [Castanea dentata]